MVFAILLFVDLTMSDVRSPLFFFWWITFSTDCLHLAKKNENLSIRRWYLRWFQMPLEGLRFVKTLATFGVVYATNHHLQNMNRMVCLRWLTFNIFNYKPLQTILNYVQQFFKIRVFLTINLYRPYLITCNNSLKSGYFSTRFISETKSVIPNFFISDTSNSLSERSKN